MSAEDAAGPLRGDDRWTKTALFLLHRDLPREGPGSDACTREALRRLPRLPPDPVVVDLGCGPGRSVARPGAGAGGEGRRRRPPRALPRPARPGAADAGLVPPRSSRDGPTSAAPGIPARLGRPDLVGGVGLRPRLRGGPPALAPLLKPGGLMAVTECTWLVDDPPDEPRGSGRRPIRRWGPSPRTVAMPRPPGWRSWTPSPSRRRPGGTSITPPCSPAPPPCARRPTPSWPPLLDETEREVDLFRRHGGSYGYVFYLLRAPVGSAMRTVCPSEALAEDGPHGGPYAHIPRAGPRRRVLGRGRAGAGA